MSNDQEAKERETGIGARLMRKEDDRYLNGKGRYIADIRMPGMLELAFLRSPLAHANETGTVG